jgi:hypothetical protein
VRKTHGVILLTTCGVIGLFLWLLYFACGSMSGFACGMPNLPDISQERLDMDAWFIVLTVALALSTWGAIVLFARLLKP